MKQVNIYEAKTNLSALVDKAYKGSPFIIAKSGRPMVKVEAYQAQPTKSTRLGAMKGKMRVPKDIKAVSHDEIIALFEGNDS
ncbi:MAG: type II toxin-antitoxin system prevent-host-death family antitoxin [Coriobacteriaceae bacterium]|jgi:antitoxin (DNA-binding transcriptional repressor) of toxin-antitoxin stability system|nr:type II toxin-antitoxin system prevent-host-death family antitoxin [Coriobacteriaceae bacterium]